MSECLKTMKGAKVLLTNSGKEANTVEIARALQEKGIKAIIASSEELQWKDTRRFKKYFLPTIGFQKGYLKNFLKKAIEEEGIDIVHCMDRLTSVAGVLAARESGVPVVVHLLDHWIACLRSTAIDYNNQKCVECYYGNTHGKLMKCFPKKRILWETYRLGALKEARQIVLGADAFAYSGKTHEKSLEKFMDPSKTSTVQPPIDTKKFSGAKPLDRIMKLGKKRIGFAARLSYEKGALQLKEVGKKILEKEKDAVLVIAGKGELEEELKRFFVENSLEERVFFLGWLDFREIPSFYKSLDLFLTMPILNEPFGRACAESMAAGIPVIASNTGESPNIVVEGKTGFLVNPFDTDECASKACKIMGDKKLRRMMSRLAAREAKKYSFERFVDKMEKIYLKALQKNTGC